MSIKIKIFLVAIIALAGYLIIDLIIETEGERVEAVIHSARTMVEEEDLGLLDLIDPDFQYREYGYEDVANNLTDFYHRFDRIRIDLKIDRVLVTNSLAECSLKARITGVLDSMPVLLFGEILSRSPVVVRLRKKGGRWLIRRVDAS